MIQQHAISAIALTWLSQTFAGCLTQK